MTEADKALFWALVFFVGVILFLVGIVYVAIWLDIKHNTMGEIYYMCALGFILSGFFTWLEYYMEADPHKAVYIEPKVYD